MPPPPCPARHGVQPLHDGTGLGPQTLILALLLAQNCPPVDLEKQKADEQACRAAGGEWAKFGAVAYLCGIYSCAERTKDGGKPCRNRADCEHLCVTEKHLPIGAEASGRCTAVKSSYGCYAHVDGGRIVGRICVD